MSFRVVLFFLSVLIVGPLSGNPVDGRWNGKAWEFEELKKKVAEGDADALAEWAYCMRENWFDLHGSPKDIFTFAKRASEKGSSLGDALLSRMYTKGLGVEKDTEKGIAYAKKAHQAGHPLGTKNVASLYFLDSGEFKRDNKMIYDLNKKAADAGCLIAMYNLALFQVYGDVYQKKDPRAAGRKLAKLVLTHDLDIAVFFILKNQYYSRRGIGDYLPEEVLEKCLSIAKRKIQAFQDSESLCLLGCYHLSKGDKATGIPLLLQSYKSPRPSILSRQVMFYLSRGYRMGHREKIFGAEEYTLQEISLSGIELGINDDNMYLYGGLSRFHVLNGKPKNYREGVELLIESHLLGENDALTEIGKMLVYRRTQKEFQNIPLGLAVLTYHTKEDVNAWGYLADTLFKKGTPLYDPVKGYALNANLFPRDNITSSSKVRFKKQAEILKEVLSEAQLKEAEALIKGNYPLGDRYRAEAFEMMKKHHYFRKLK